MSKTEETTIPFETVEVPNGDKPVGFREVISDGADGKRTVTYSDDGQILSDRTKHPRNEVISVGTKEDGEQTDSLSTGDADDVTQGNSTETVSSQSEGGDSTPDSPQGESPKDTTKTKIPIEYPDIPPISPDSVQSQGRFSENDTKSQGGFMNSTALKKAALEAGRLLVFAIPGVLITVLTNNPELGGSLGATILLVLKSLDRGIHEDKSTDATGILPF